MTSYGVPPRLAVVIADDADDAEAPRVYLMAVPDGSPVVLRDVSAVIWLLAADGEEEVAVAVGDVVGRDPSQVEGEVDRHLRDLVAAGLLIIRSD